MNHLPNLTEHGYQVTRELGRNREGGRITWQGISLSTQQTVIIKQFCFATVGSTWSGYKAYQQEIQVLQKLEHPGIPKYLDSIETERGFCVIQEYKQALKLSDFRQVSLAETKQIILAVLEILIYLQQQNPPILHRDIKPENILIDEQLKVYLVDFGFASIGSQDISPSSIAKGTPGFMAPEQIVKPTVASDLYSLGVTAICLLTGKKSTEILELTTADNPYQLNFKPFLPPLNRQFINWLNKMVQPQASKRFSNAATAKAALEPIALEPIEKVQILSGTLARLRSQMDINLGLGTGAIAILSTTAVLSINFAYSRSNNTAVNLAIAIVAAAAVTVAELGAGTIAITDKQAVKPAFAIAILVPAILVATSMLLRGMTAAVAIAAAITVAEIICLAYFLLQPLPLKQWNKTIRAICLLGAISIGLTLGLVSIL